MTSDRWRQAGDGEEFGSWAGHGRLLGCSPRPRPTACDAQTTDMPRGEPLDVVLRHDTGRQRHEQTPSMNTRGDCIYRAVGTDHFTRAPCAGLA